VFGPRRGSQLSALVSGSTAVGRESEWPPFGEILSVILLFSPSPRHNTEALVVGWCQGQQREVRVPYFDHPLWPRTREEFYQRRAEALARERQSALLNVAVPWGLAG
jgi:hypothetical protein